MSNQPVGKTTIILTKPINKALNQYRQDHLTAVENLPSKTSTINLLLKKALEAEGYQVEEKET